MAVALATEKAGVAPAGRPLVLKVTVELKPPDIVSVVT